MREIYLDNAATTPVLEDSAKIAFDIMTDNFGNPSSIHNRGFEAEKVMNDARKIIAESIGADTKEIFFTSGATEANNIAIIGSLRANKRIGNHIITSSIEHSSVRNVIKHLEEEEGFEVTYLPVDKYGIVDLDELKKSLRTDTVLVSIMYVNNETGIIQPIDKIGNIISKHSDKCIYHVDAVQAIGKIPINVKRTRIDMLAASAHKFHGPKGIGFLYKKQKTKVNNITFGGGQEQNMRSGTENVPGIAAMANSLNEAVKSLEESFDSRMNIKKLFIDGLLKIEGTSINGFKEGSNSPYIINASFKDIRSEVLIHALEEKGVYASSGSACSSHSKVKNGTLFAMGKSSGEMDSSVRFSFNRFTDIEDINEALKILNELVPILNKFKRK